ncbi:hypothetical protein JCM8547_006978 [Rhodosporidiobolus lusitaniae]
MTIPRTPAYALNSGRWHYARFLVTPLDSKTGTAVDEVTLLQLVDSVLREFYGTMGGPGGMGEVDVVQVKGAAGGKSTGDIGEGGPAREAVIRFLASTAYSLLTALPLSTPSVSGQAYRLAILSHSGDLQRVSSSPAGKGAGGYKGWVKALKEEGKEKKKGEAMVEG